MRTPARKRFITALLIPCAFAALVALGANSLLKVDAEVERIADLRGLNETFVEISANASKAVVFIQAEARVERTARSVRPRNKFEEELFRRFSVPNAAPGDQCRRTNSSKRFGRPAITCATSPASVRKIVNISRILISHHTNFRVFIRMNYLNNRLPNQSMTNFSSHDQKKAPHSPEYGAENEPNFASSRTYYQ